MRGTPYVGTSGFAYPGWHPLFYRPGTPPQGLLGAYAAQLPSVEINNSYYRHPSAEQVAAWVGQVPEGFRFTVKAHRNGSLRAFTSDPAATLPWLTNSLRTFGVTLGAALFRVPEQLPRDDERLDRLLSAWPPELPLAVDFQHRSWHVEPVRARLRDAGAAMCLTDLDDLPEPDIVQTAPFVYLRLRRSRYEPADIDRWAARLVTVLGTGSPGYVFLRHDARGENALVAQQLLRRLTLSTDVTGR